VIVSGSDDESPLTSSPTSTLLSAMASLSPTTLTNDEQRVILRATAGNVRDHTMISLALGTGLRLAEVVGLDVGDVFAPDGTPRVRVRVRKEIAKGGRAAHVFLPDRLVAKLKRFWRWKRRRGEDLSPDSALLCNQSGRRISKRRVQMAWAMWQRRAGVELLGTSARRFGETTLLVTIMAERSRVAWMPLRRPMEQMERMTC
jgi:integrase